MSLPGKAFHTLSIMFHLTLEALVVFLWDRLFLNDWVFLVLLRKNRFRLMWLINFFNWSQARLKRLKKRRQLLTAFFNRKRLEKCYIETRQPYKLKPVAVETVDPSRPRPVALIFACCAIIIRYHDFLQTSTLLHVLSMLFLTVILCSTVFVV